MIHLDTHVAIWLHARARRRLSGTARGLIEREPARISPMVLLEIDILVEIGRIGGDASTLIRDLGDQIGLTIADTAFASVVDRARRFAWTRDPFDRLIVASAMADGARLITADAAILANFKDAVW